MTTEPARQLCHIEELADPGALGFDLADEGQDQFFVVHVAGQVHAWRNACPHVADGPMAWRRHAYLDATRQWIQCHAHGALFDPHTGLCHEGPCKGRYLTPVTVRVTEDGHVNLHSQPK